MRKTGSSQELERVRLIAANMFELGLQTQQVAASLSVDDQTVRRWRRIFKAGGHPGLRSKSHPGGKSRLSQQQRDQLAQMLLKTPAELGFAKYLWTTELIAALILREFGVNYHHDYVGTMLHEMGFTHQKPARRSKERDEARIDSWRGNMWPALLKKVPTAVA